MRDIKVDTLRGLACVFLVAYHVIGNNETNGLKVSDGWLRDINDLLECVRMPLFTFLSGMVYALRPVQSNWRTFMKGKVRRLLVPMLVVGTFFAIVQSFVPGTNNNIDNWWLIHIYPVQHFWFVEALFFVFVLVVPLELSKLLNKKAYIIAVICVFLLFSAGQPYTKLLAFKGFIYLTPFFLFGLYVVRFKLPSLPQLSSVCLFSVLMLTLFFNESNVYGKGFLGCCIGLLSCYLLLCIRLQVPFLARIGIYSYSIYIFHVFFTAATRLILGKLVTLPLELNLLAGVTAGIVGPIVVYIIAQKIPIASFLLLGQRIKRTELNKS
jgi:peptidoglycan/LPS O-acetylase OafA/YrhL